MCERVSADWRQGLGGRNCGNVRLIRTRMRSKEIKRNERSDATLETIRFEI